MNQQYIPDWSGAMVDTFAPLGGGDDDGLIELLWCNGHVVMQSQAALRKPSRPDKAAAPAAVQDEDAAAAAAAWFQYQVEDPLERDDLFAELFGEAQAAVDAGRGACCKEEAEERGGDEDARQSSGMMPPPQPLPREVKACPGDGAAARTSAGCCEATATATEGAESSMLTIGSSFCGSNHVQQTTPRARDAAAPPGAAKDVARARGAATDTSSATRSRSCTTKSEHPGPGAAAAAARRSGKRKQSDATDAEVRSPPLPARPQSFHTAASIDDDRECMLDVEFESADVTCEPAQKTATAKRRRAAEVHNLSERRRRDRINEKMKALQELIPHCNKTDKASMLDEAIEYLKSLQLQLQMMWMGGGMAAAAAPVVFPAGVHQYMQRMVAGPPPHHVASMPGMPFMAPPAAVHGPPPPVPDLYARYLAVDHHHHLPPPPPLVAPPPYTVQQHCLQGTMGFYQRQNPALPPPPTAVPAGSPSDGILHKKYENCGKPEIQGMTG